MVIFKGMLEVATVVELDDAAGVQSKKNRFSEIYKGMHRRDTQLRVKCLSISLCGSLFGALSLSLSLSLSLWLSRALSLELSLCPGYMYAFNN